MMNLGTDRSVITINLAAHRTIAPRVMGVAVRRLRDPVEKASKTEKSATISKQHPALFRGTGVSGASGVIVFRLKTHAMERI